MMQASPPADIGTCTPVLPARTEALHEGLEA